MTFTEVLKDINDVKEADRESYAYRKYGDFFPKELIYYLFVKHSWLYSLDLFRYFDDIDLGKCIIEPHTITTEELFTIIDYAPPCTHRDESLDAYNSIKGYAHWPNGTWPAPILVVKRKDKYLVIDGNNRLRMLRAYVKHSGEYVSPYHLANVLVEKSSKK